MTGQSFSDKNSALENSNKNNISVHFSTCKSLKFAESIERFNCYSENTGLLKTEF